MVKKRPGALPVASEFLRRLDVAGIVDELCPGGRGAGDRRVRYRRGRLRCDMTSMSVYGAYPAEDQDERCPVIKHGHPEERRVDLKQVQAGIAVSADGGIPIHDFKLPHTPFTVYPGVFDGVLAPIAVTTRGCTRQ